MTNKKQALLSIMLLSTSSGTVATDAANSAKTRNHSTMNNIVLKQTIANAIERFEQTQLSDWSHQISRYENEEGDVTSSVERYTADNPDSQRWTLISSNGEQATEQQQRAFQEKKHNQDDNVSISLDLHQLIVNDSLRLKRETQNTVIASFDVYFEQLGEEASEHLTGTLLYSKQDAYIESITILNNEPFSPMLAATVDDLSLTLTFMLQDEFVLPHRIDFQMQGRFAIFSEIDEVSTDEYSDFIYIGDTRVTQ